MRVRIDAAPLSSPSLPHRSLTLDSAAWATCMLLLATPDGGGAPVGSLQLQRDPAAPFAVHASGLRLASPADSPEGGDAARQLLWHAAREHPDLRCGSALLARPVTPSDEGVLRGLGFELAGGDVAEGSGEDVAQGSGANASASPLMALVARRDPAEPSGFSHATLRVSCIRQSLAFWSLLHYEPRRRFTTNGARAAWLCAPWTPLSIELVEAPCETHPLNLRDAPSALRDAPSAEPTPRPHAREADRAPPPLQTRSGGPSAPTRSPSLPRPCLTPARPDRCRRRCCSGRRARRRTRRRARRTSAST